MREQLLGYLLGALDASEHEQVEAALRHDEELRREAELLRRHLAILDDGLDSEPVPAGLAERTSERVACLAAEQSARPAAMDRLSPVYAGEGRRNSWSITDWVVAAGVVAATALLFLPVIANSREMARLTTCQDHLRELGSNLATFSDTDPDHCFPAVPSEGPYSFAGVYAPTLAERGLMVNSRVVICPASELAEHQDAWRLPTLEQVRDASPVELARLRQLAGGSYGYQLGVIAEGRHVPTRDEGRAQFAIMSDAPQSSPLDKPANGHLGRGQNVLYEDGHVMFIVGLPNDCADHPFRNRRGNVEAGVDRDDVVIASSPTAPFVRYINYSK